MTIQIVKAVPPAAPVHYMTAPLIDQPELASPHALKQSLRVPQARADPAESIYRLIPPNQETGVKPAMYISKHRPDARQQYFGSHVRPAATIGPLRVDRPQPTAFLRGQDGAARFQQLASAAHATAEPIKREARAIPPARAVVPGVPAPGAPLSDVWRRAAPAPATAVHDWITENAVTIIAQPARRPGPPPPSYRAKTDYGRTPQYLAAEQRGQVAPLTQQARQSFAAHAARLRSEAQVAADAHAAAQREARDARTPSQQRPMAEHEREAVLAKLKHKWSLLNDEYGKLSLVADTIPKIQRKITLENKLKKIETDVDRFSHPNIILDFSQ